MWEFFDEIKAAERTCKGLLKIGSHVIGWAVFRLENAKKQSERRKTKAEKAKDKE